MTVSLQYVHWKITTWHFCPAVIVNAPHSVTVVSARDVESDAAATVPVAFAFTRVPLGLPELSVSIRTQRAAAGAPVFERLSFRVDALVPLPNTGNETRVLAAISLTY